jgi:mRNA-degrading endonuclease RelE of RelBE toxin-antitoxin system
VAYQVTFSAESLQHVEFLSARQRQIVLSGIREQLSYEPMVETRNRKLMRPNPLAVWELRIENLRVYYDVDTDESIVDIRAVGVKEGNRVFIAGEEIEL